MLCVGVIDAGGFRGHLHFGSSLGGTRGSRVELHRSRHVFHRLRGRGPFAPTTVSVNVLRPTS